MASQLEGVRDLARQLDEIGNPKQYASALRSAVRVPMRAVQVDAKANLGKISPGKTLLHKTYLGRYVTMGFAQRSVRLIVGTDRGKTVFRAILGVRKEAFYVLQFFELGTAFIPRLPWLQPAFYKSRERSLRMLTEELRAYIDRILRKNKAKK